MTDSIGRLQVDLEARIAKFESDIGRAARILQKDMVNAQRAAERAATQMRKTMEREAERIRQQYRNLGAAVLGFVSVQQLARMTGQLANVADEYANVTAKLKLATNGQEELIKTSAEVYRISQATFTSLNSTATLAARTTRALNSAGMEGQAALATSLQLTETINKAFAVSGATTAEAENAIIQLSQGLAAGALRGEEYNSVAEQGSRITQALSQALGKTTGELRALAKEGKLTTDVVVRALLGQTEAINAEFEKLPLTISRAKTYLDNAFTRFVGEADQASGASRDVAKMIKAIADNLPALISGFMTAARIAAAYFAIYRVAIPLIGAVVTAHRQYVTALAATAIAEEMGYKTTEKRVNKLAAAGNLLFAAFAGWEFGKYLRSEFEVVADAGDYLVYGLSQGWEEIKRGAKIVAEAFKAYWLGAFNLVRDGAAKFITFYADAVESVDFLGLNAGMIAKMREVAAAVKPAASAWEGFKVALKDIQTEYEANSAANDAMLGDMQMATARMFAQKEATESAAVALGELPPIIDDVGDASKDAEKKLEALRRAQAAFEHESDQLRDALATPMFSNMHDDAAMAAEAWQEYAAGVRDAVKELHEGGTTVDGFIRRQKLLLQQMRLTTLEYKLQREERQKERLNSAQGSAQEFANSQQEEINRLEEQIAGRVELEHVMRAEEEIRRITAGLTKGQILLMQDEIDQIRAKAQELERLNAIMRVGSSISGVLDGVTDAIVNGGNPWQALFGGLADSLPDIIKDMDKLGKLAGTWGENLMAIGEQILPSLGTALGTVLGGGGQNAQLGAQLGSNFGFLGSLLGGWIGGLFDGDPRIRAAGANAQLGVSAGATYTGAFGFTQIREQDSDLTNPQVAAALEEFDFALASLLTDSQVAAATAALSTWSVDLQGGNFGIEQLLQARFDAVLDTLGPEIESFVQGFAFALEDQMQAVGEIVALQEMESQGDLITGTLSQTLALIEELANAGESVAEVYNRLSQAAASYAQIVAAAQDEISLGNLSEAMQQAVAIRREEMARIEALNRAAVAIGLTAAREEDLAIVREAAAAKMARLIAEVELDIADLAAELYGTPLEQIEEQIRALGGAADGAGRSVAEFLASLALSEQLSPFTDRQRRATAEDALRAAAASGNSEAFINAAEQFLTISRALNASGADYRSDFDLVNSLGAAFGVGTGNNADALAQLYAQRDAILAQQEAARRLGLATDLAGNVADLASLQGVDVMGLLSTLGLDPTRLAADLGLSGVDSLTDYLTSLQADEDFLAQTLYELPERIARELFDLVFAGIPVTAPGGVVIDPGTGPIGGGTAPGGGGVVIPDPGFPEIPNDPLRASSDSKAAPVSDEALRAEVALLSAKMELLLSHIRDNTGRTAEGVVETVRQQRSHNLDFEGTKPRSTRGATVF